MLDNMEIKKNYGRGLMEQSIKCGNIHLIMWTFDNFVIDSEWINLAIEYGKTDILSWLIYKKCPVDKNVYEKTMEKSEFRCVKVLLENNVKYGSDIIKEIIDSGDIESIQTLIDKTLEKTLFVDTVMKYLLKLNNELLNNYFLEKAIKKIGINNDILIFILKIGSVKYLNIVLNYINVNSVIEDILKYSTVECFEVLYKKINWDPIYFVTLIKHNKKVYRWAIDMGLRKSKEVTREVVKIFCFGVPKKTKIGDEEIKQLIYDGFEFDTETMKLLERFQYYFNIHFTIYKLMGEKKKSSVVRELIKY